MASEDESSSAFVSESEEEKEVLVNKEGVAAETTIEEAEAEAEETAEEDNGEEDEEEEEDDAEDAAGDAEGAEPWEDVVMLLCVLNLDDGDVLKKRKIWRRVAVPADFSLLELHVALQNAFDWEDTHLHDFTQPRRHSWRRLLSPATALADETPDSETESETKPSTVAVAEVPPLPDTQYRGFGRTQLAAVAELLQLDLDSLPPGFRRTFKTVAGAKEEAADDLILSVASLDLGKGEGEAEGKGEEGEGEGAVGAEVVFVEHADAAAEGEGAKEAATIGGFGEVLDERAFEVGSVFSKTDPLLVYQYDFGTRPPSLRLPFARFVQVLDERAFEVGSVFSKADPLLVYQYDFGMSYEVHLIFEGKFPATEGVNYPTCLAGAGASPAEDGNDMDEEGALLPSYDYNDFAVLDVLANFEKTFEDSWPVGPGSEDSIDAPRCYMCRYNRECGRRRECTGRCCGYCLKHPLHLLAGSIALRDADSAYERLAAKLAGQKKSDA